MKSHKLARIAEAVREVASETILFELQDPRIKGVTVTRAEVSADLQKAKVFVSLVGDSSEQKLCMYGLQHSAGFIQAKLARRIQTRYTPVIEFVIDEGIKKSLEVTRLLNEERKIREEHEATQDEANVQNDSTDGTVEEHADPE